VWPLEKISEYAALRQGWTRSRGRALVNAIAKTPVFADKIEVLFIDIGETVYVVPRI
jgi:hypothetical protein